MTQQSPSGPVDRDVGAEVEECDWIVAQVLVELGAAQGRTALEIDPSITSNFALRRAVVRAAWEAAKANQAGELDRLRADLELVRGAMKADDERLRIAGERVGIVAGCDTAEWMADEIDRLRAENQALRAGLERLARIYEGEQEPCERPAWLRELLKPNAALSGAGRE